MAIKNTKTNKSVDLSFLPRHKNRGIKWKDSVGKSFHLIYGNIESDVIITEWVDAWYIKITIPNYVVNYKIATSNILKVNFGNALGFNTGVEFKKFSYNIGDIINDNILIVDTIIKYSKNNKRRKYYKCQCLKDGQTWEVGERNLLMNETSCPCCTNRIVVKGINDINTTNPKIAQLFKYEEDRYRYHNGAQVKVMFKCPICGDERLVLISNVVKFGYTCLKCGDGISYPNKFVLEIIKQVYIKNNWDRDLIEPEFRIDCDKDFVLSDKIKKYVKYDLYLKDKNIIIENHGEQHYKDTSFCKYIQQKENDIQKQQLALRNNIKEYIVLNCSKSNINFIKNQ